MLKVTSNLPVGVPLTTDDEPVMAATTSALSTVLRVSVLWSGAMLAPCDAPIAILVLPVSVELPSVVGAVKANVTVLDVLLANDDKGPKLMVVTAVVPVPVVANVAAV